MEAFTQISSSLVPLFVDNIDTDQIIPARFLKQTSREGFGENLFRDWRFDSNNQPKTEFILNNPSVKGNILLAGDNFGCGSSREHAVWALADYGFRAVISTSFADIFKNNALNNGVLPIEVSSEFYEIIKQTIEENPTSLMTIDLENQIIKINSQKMKFEVDAFKKLCMMQGKDEFAFLVDIKEEIAQFETQE
ncbi:MAG: 3-isopropylmalate dehydratase small subunit [Flavobacteriales bacterium]